MAIDSTEISQTFIAAQALAGDDARGVGPEDAVDEEGYDESQRAEILEVEGTGPTDGVIQTDLAADLGGSDPDEDEIEDAADMLDTVEDTDEAVVAGSGVLGANEQGSERLLDDDAEALAGGEDDDFDVDDEDADPAVGTIGS